MDIVLTILKATWGMLREMSPYLLLGFAVAGVLSLFLSREAVEKHLSGRGIRPVLKAALLGVPLPLCSCSVLPVAGSLRKHGSGRGATAAFLLSTPQTGVDSILVTYSLLGPVFAVIRPLAAFFSGLVGGCLTGLLENKRDALSRKPQVCSEPCCDHRRGPGRVLRALHHGFVTLPRDMGLAMLAGIAVAGLIAIIIPNDFLVGWADTGFSAMLLMLLLGIPVYVCATASVPIAAVLIAKGVSPGAALVFLMTGPATNAAAIAMIWQILGRRTALVYLGTVAVTAVVSGLLLDHLLRSEILTVAQTMGHALPPSLKTLSALALLAVFGYARWEPFKKAGRRQASESQISGHSN